MHIDLINSLTPNIAGDVRVSRVSGAADVSCHPLKIPSLALTVKRIDSSVSGEVI
jgi:hypothetical protein